MTIFTNVMWISPLWCGVRTADGGSVIISPGITPMNALATGWEWGHHPIGTAQTAKGESVMAKATISVPVSIDLSTIQRWMESSDIVEVVRCKDCRFYSPRLWEGDTACCINVQDGLISFPGESDYCSSGERKGEEVAE